MRLLTALVVLWPLTAAAETQLGVHAGGGMEAGTTVRAHPEGMAEAGAVLAWILPHRTWGLAVAGERIGRDRDDLGDEWKLDAGVSITNPERSFHAIIAIGARTMTLAGDEWRPASTIRGIDLMRIDAQLEVARRGRVAIDVYFDWTFGVYHGAREEMRVDEPPSDGPSYTAITTTYVLGVQTRMRLDR